MKNIFLIIAICLTGVSSLFSQGAWELLVTWDDSDQNCACGTYTTAQFKIVMEIYDDANEASVGTQTVYVNYTANEYTFDCSSSPIDVDYYCNVINPEHPVLQLNAGLHLAIMEVEYLKNIVLRLIGCRCKHAMNLAMEYFFIQNCNWNKFV